MDPCGGSHVRGLDAGSPLRRIRQLISLIITPARTNDPPTGSMHLGGIQTRITTSHAESSDLTRTLSLQKEEDFSPRREKSARTSPTTLPNQTHQTHTQDLRLFRCELSKSSLITFDSLHTPVTRQPQCHIGLLSKRTHIATHKSSKVSPRVCYLETI